MKNMTEKLIFLGELKSDNRKTECMYIYYKGYKA